MAIARIIVPCKIIVILNSYNFFVINAKIIYSTDPKLTLARKHFWCYQSVLEHDK